ncbi:MAG: hypothetical protein ABW185_01700 [Sedimenticola sp.]
MSKILHSDTVADQYVTVIETESDQTQALVVERFKVYNRKFDGQPGKLLKFSINCYNTTSRILVNGNYVRIFIDSIFKELCVQIQKQCKNLNILNTTITETINKQDATNGYSAPSLAVTHEKQSSPSINQMCFCPVCNEEAGVNTIGCDECDNWYHYDCVGVSKENAENIQDSIPYICSSCNDDVLYGKDMSNTQQRHTENHIPATAHTQLETTTCLQTISHPSSTMITSQPSDTVNTTIRVDTTPPIPTQAEKDNDTNQISLNGTSQPLTATNINQHTSAGVPDNRVTLTTTPKITSNVTNTDTQTVAGPADTQKSKRQSSKASKAKDTSIEFIQKSYILDLESKINNLNSTISLMQMHNNRDTSDQYIPQAPAMVDTSTRARPPDMSASSMDQHTPQAPTMPKPPMPHAIPPDINAFSMGNNTCQCSHLINQKLLEERIRVLELQNIQNVCNTQIALQLGRENNHNAHCGINHTQGAPHYPTLTGYTYAPYTHPPPVQGGMQHPHLNLPPHWGYYNPRMPPQFPPGTPHPHSHIPYLIQQQQRYAQVHAPLTQSYGPTRHMVHPYSTTAYNRQQLAAHMQTGHPTVPATSLHPQHTMWQQHGTPAAPFVSHPNFEPPLPTANPQIHQHDAAHARQIGTPTLSNGGQTTNVENTRVHPICIPTQTNGRQTVDVDSTDMHTPIIHHAALLENVQELTAVEPLTDNNKPNSPTVTKYEQSAYNKAVTTEIHVETISITDSDSEDPATNNHEDNHEEGQGKTEDAHPVKGCSSSFLQVPGLKHNPPDMPTLIQDTTLGLMRI